MGRRIRRVGFLGALLGALAPPAAAPAAGPTPAPILRIEPGTHISRITGISTDAQGRWVATVSLDMTVRIWDVADGGLLRVLRPPIDGGAGVGQELDAAAMSPDGTLVAVGGRVGANWAGAGMSANVFLFDRAGGRLLRRIEIPLASRQFVSAVTALTFSPDGRWLAVGLQHEGLRLYAADSGRETSRDMRRGTIDALDFSPDSRRLIAAAPDRDVSTLMRYDVDDGVLRPGPLVDSQHMTLPAQLADARFSPDGHFIAVAGSGPDDQVEVLDADTLRLAWLPVANGVAHGAAQIDLLRWAADGRLFATGNWRAEGAYQLRIWSRSGLKFTDLPVGDRRLFDMASLPDGRMLFASVEPAWGVIAADGRSLERRARPPTVDYAAANPGGHIGVSADGRRLQFRFQREDLNPTVFDVDQGYQRGRDAAPLQPAPPALDLDLRDPAHPRLNGRPFAPGADAGGQPAVTCSAVAQDARHFALCIPGRLVYFSDSGRELWRTAAFGGAVLLAALSADGRWVIAAFGDGTVRWLRTADGAEMLALFAHADRRRWALWSAGGYYSASAGGEDLVGWHVNRGSNAAADFYPLSRCRAWLLRPDVIDQLIATGDEAAALRAADRESGRNSAPPPLPSILPPAVTILSSDELSGAARLKLALRTPADAPVTAIRARINGLPVQGQVSMAGLDAEGQSIAELSLPLPAGDAAIQVFAENRNAASAPAQLTIAQLKPAGGASVERPKPRLFVLAVGISSYDNPDYRLEFAAKDAADFAAAMQKQQGALYGEVEVRLLTDARARRGAVLDGLDWLRRSVTSADTAVLLLAGHGLSDRLGVYYFAPADFDLIGFERTGIGFSAIREALANIAGRAVFFVDSCHAGNALGGRHAEVNGMINELSSAENGVAVLSASTGRQEAQESPAWGHGAFTKAILEGVGGGADYQKSGRITLKMLDLYLSLRVTELTAGRQTPVIIAPFGLADFEIARD